MVFFGLKHSQDLERLATHFHKNSDEQPPPPSPAGNFERQATCRPPKPLTSWHSVTIVPPMQSNLGSHALTSSRGLMSRVRSPLSNGLLVVCLNCSWNKSDWLFIFTIYAQKRQKWNIIIKCTVRCYKLLCLGKKKKKRCAKRKQKVNRKSIRL